MEEFKSFFKEVKSGEGDRCHYATRLDTYGRGCTHDCNYCVSPDTEVLMYDGSIKKIADVEVGSTIYGLEFVGNKNKIVKSTVLNKTFVHKKAYKIVLANGNTIICSGDHQWLTNRGWKFTTGKMSGENRRPYLTEKNRLIGFPSLHGLKTLEETEDYKAGYLRGVIVGDAHVGEYHYGENSKRKSNDQYQFRLALKNEKITYRAYKYLMDHGIETHTFAFPMVDRKTKEHYSVTAIRTHKKENYDRIREIIAKRDNDEFVRGFLAGIYDAEGCNDVYIHRLYNANDDIIADIESGLQRFGFAYTRDKDQITVNKVCHTVRIVGGLSENLRFNALTG